MSPNETYGKKFWLVCVEGTNLKVRPPKVYHINEESACKEAERLAREHDKPVYILEAKTMVTIPTPVQYTDLG